MERGGCGGGGEWGLIEEEEVVMLGHHCHL